MQQLNLQLYARSKGGSFTEEQSMRRSVALTAEPAKVELQIPCKGQADIVELRLDPDDKPSLFALHGLTVRSTAGDELFAWNGSAEGLPSSVGLTAWEQSGQIIVESSTADPFLLIPIDPPARGLILECVVGSAMLDEYPEKLAEAVRTLQFTLRAGIDEVASGQETMQEFVLLSQRQSSTNLNGIHKRIDELASLSASSAKELRQEIMHSARDDWRSVLRKIDEAVETVSRNQTVREATSAEKLEAEFAKLREVVGKAASSQPLMGEIRYELGVRRDEDAISAIQRLKAEVESLRERVNKIESGLLWRLAHPFR